MNAGEHASCYLFQEVDSIAEGVDALVVLFLEGLHIHFVCLRKGALTLVPVCESRSGDVFELSRLGSPVTMMEPQIAASCPCNDTV